ncbi:hypothetical protein LINPERPRIM_LOCUS15035, partial [Linum perenne]
MNALATTEKLKADLLTKATIQYENRVQEANSDLPVFCTVLLESLSFCRYVI